MATTTIRVDTQTHARLVELSEAAGSSIVDTVRAATEALRRQQYAHRIAAELADMRQDHTAWQSYLAEADSTSVADGIG